VKTRPGDGHQKFQQPKLGRTEMHFPLAAMDALALAVELDVAIGSQLLRNLLGARAAQQPRTRASNSGTENGLTM
jgi:hypothetical protein